MARYLSASSAFAGWRKGSEDNDNIEHDFTPLLSVIYENGMKWPLIYGVDTFYGDRIGLAGNNYYLQDLHWFPFPETNAIHCVADPVKLAESR
jgi:hypothetical protein